MKIHLNWGAGIALTYSMFALSTLGFVAFAMSHAESLVSPQYYTQALQHDGRMEAGTNAAALGGALSCVVSADGTMVILKLPPGHHGAQGTVTLYRPSDARSDRTAPLRIDEHGVHRVSLSGAPSGRWRLQVDWVAGGLPYYYEHILEVR